MTSEQSGGVRIPGLDGLRGLAALSVIVFHFYFQGATTLLGTLGVDTFFVLSGFLITGILLNCRKLCDEGQPIFPTVRRFYIRRFLRIFPLFYLALFLATLLNLPGARQGFWWHATYTCNFYMAIHQKILGATGHFWTLAVEEQFYLAWPWVILFSSRKWLPRIIFAVVLAGILFRVATLHLPINASLLPFACLDPLGMGALLAVLSEHSMRKSLSVVRLLGVVAGLPLLALVMLLNYTRRFHSLEYVLGNMAVALVAAILILLCSESSGRTARLLSFRPLSYLGVISYGLYVYHLPVWYLMGFDWTVHSLHRTFFGLVVTLAVATVSWHFFESPINSAKRHFSYRVVPKEVVPELPLQPDT
jgi:peptidoglycan/LPS O-acetylase OafA/YrhL